VWSVRRGELLLRLENPPPSHGQTDQYPEGTNHDDGDEGFADGCIECVQC
jgi:hypothetical protein